MHLSLADQTAIVIGGTTGIGRAVSETLFDAGATVVPTSRTLKSVEQAARAVDCDLIQPTDITDRSEVRRLFERVSETYAGFNILVNCAGLVHGIKPTVDLDDDEWERTMAVNLQGVFISMQLAPSHLQGPNKSIVNIGSMTDDIVLPGLGPYAASKSAVKTLGENLAVEFAPDDIRVNTVAPGYVKTAQNADELEIPKIHEAIIDGTPLSRYATREDVASAVLFLVSPAASFITGETITVDGGFSLK